MSKSTAGWKALTMAGVVGLGVSLLGVASAPFGIDAANAAMTDTDGDGLPDVWETNGLDVDGDGVVDVDLPAMGADPKHKDLFVETDYMSGLLPSVNAMDRIVSTFAQAPISNPDNKGGIKLHIDAGGAGGPKYNLGGGNQVTYDNDLNPAEQQAKDIRSQNFDSKRSKVFRYMIWADSYDGDCSSGNAFKLPNDLFIVTLGPKCGWNATEDMQVGTFIHEFGHTLGLSHGGSDNGNYKPNYLSVMNYSFQFSGVPKADGTFKFSYSDVNPISLNENSLNENTGLGSAASSYKTVWFCANGTKKTTSGATSNPIDWNCNGTASGTVSSDINKDNSRSTLTAQNNWANISYKGGAVGSGTSNSRSAQVPEDLTEPELTKLDWDQLKQGKLPESAHHKH